MNGLTSAQKHLNVQKHHDVHPSNNQEVTGRMIFSLCSPSPRSDEVTKRMQYTVVLFHHQVKAQLEFAASEDASGGSPSASNEVYASPLPLASYSG